MNWLEALALSKGMDLSSLIIECKELGWREVKDLNERALIKIVDHTVYSVSDGERFITVEVRIR